ATRPPTLPSRPQLFEYERDVATGVLWRVHRVREAHVPDTPPRLILRNTRLGRDVRLVCDFPDQTAPRIIRSDEERVSPIRRLSLPVCDHPKPESIDF